MRFVVLMCYQMMFRSRRINKGSSGQQAMKTFYALIDRYTAADDRQRDAIQVEIWQRYGVVRAVLVLDMSSFTASVHRDGVLPYLSRIRQMHAVTAPIVAAFSGEVVKYQADDLLAVFPNATQALGAALSLRT